jgi:hypothetical protein
VFALHGNILGIEVSSFYKLGERFNGRRLGRNRVSSNHLDTTKFRPLGSSMVAVEYLYISFPTRLLSYSKLNLPYSEQSRSSFVMIIAWVGHTCEHMPHPLQYSRLIRTGIVLLMAASGQ